MAAYDFSGHRLHVDCALTPGSVVELDRAGSNYVLSVLRRADGDTMLVFNGRDGEWRARVEATGRKAARLHAEAQTRPQPAPSDLVLLFAPLKHARLDYLVQKAVEMGAGQIRPVFTRRTVAGRVNAERMRANAIEAAEQCGILAVPIVADAEDFAVAVARLEPDRHVIFCDEDAPEADAIAALDAADLSARPLALLIGPEGGFDPVERDALLGRPGTTRLSLGPRILRADTAAVAALALVQAVAGDWHRRDRPGTDPSRTGT